MEKLKDKKFAFRVSERDLNQIRIQAVRLDEVMKVFGDIAAAIRDLTGKVK